jgi:hypothetical protein
MIGDGQAGASAMLLAWTDVDRCELLSLVANLVSKGAVTQCFPPPLRFSLIMSNHLRGE